MAQLATEPVRVTVEDGIALVTIDNPPVNAISQAVRLGLETAAARIRTDAGIRAAVLACEGRTFIAGADIREFDKASLEPFLPVVCDALEGLDKPLVAAIHGTALGGGLEIALSCHARVAAPGTKLGLPEVKLGLIPGSGGTQRLPRLIGLKDAIDMMSSGRHVDAKEALKFGLIDEIAEGDLRACAIRRARTMIGRPLNQTGRLPNPPADETALKAQRAAIAARARGQESPLAAFDTAVLSARLPFAEAMQRERETFMRLKASPQSKALRYAFFAEREVSKVPRLANAKPRPLGEIGVVGAGTMGAGIAVALLDAGFPVTVVETSEAARAAGRQRITGLLDRNVKSGRLRAAEKDERLQSLAVVVDYNALKDADLIIEAVFEDMAVKTAIFRELSGLAKPGAVLATNTSYLDVGEIAKAAGQRESDVVGLHFFAPANVMRLLEIVAPPRASDEALATGLELARRLKKVPVVCGVCDGFVGNRILSTYRQQAEFALEAGAEPAEVDAAFEAYGFPMGPFKVADLSGLDIGFARRQRLAPTRDPSIRYSSTVADRLVALRRLGQKTAAGWYRYEDGKPKPDPVVADLIKSVAAERGIKQTPFDGARFQSEVRAVIVNEGAKILEEGIVARPLDIDVVMMQGYGYPSWRGGPMFEAGEIGLKSILADMEGVHAQCGKGFEPAAVLRDLVAKGQSLAERFKA